MTLLRLAARLALASSSARTITGTAVTYGGRADASTGPVIFQPGSLTMADDLKRVKLLIDHDMTQPVGYLTAADDDDERMTTTFHVPEGPAGDKALSEAALGLRDGLSVGVWIEEDGYSWDEDDTLIVSRGTVREVSLCALPAIDDARVSDVAASRRTEGRNTMPENTTAAPTATPPAPPAPATVAASTPEQPAPPAAPPAPAQAPPVQPVTANGRGLDLRAAMRKAHEVLRSGEPHRVAAVLGDIVPADDAGEGYLRPQWVGELWEASDAPRPIIDSITHQPLTGMKVYGFRKEYADLVGPYTGDKTAVPSGTFETVPAEASAQRWAGGNDIDRIYVDLGGPGFIESWFTAAVDEYRIESETYVTTQVSTAATAVAGATSVTQALGLIGSAAAEHSSEVSWVVFSSAAWQEFINLTADQVPWWLQRQGEIHLGTVSGNAGGIRFSVTPALPGNEVLAGDRRAATFYEVDPPIRVQALNIPNGGVDVGVFGYGAVLVNDPAALFRAVITPAP